MRMKTWTLWKRPVRLIPLKSKCTHWKTMFSRRPKQKQCQIRWYRFGVMCQVVVNEIIFHMKKPLKINSFHFCRWFGLEIVSSWQSSMVKPLEFKRNFLFSKKSLHNFINKKRNKLNPESRNRALSFHTRIRHLKQAVGRIEQLICQFS